ncbi:MAG: hypothetical protein HN844_09800 [Planctomycetes bacterium]|jgi:hypothetical protein|nr:hypothetical protein [Planctomycetota bacterium]MBT7319491.1 hypothetical protein [Planctomycetota bacterium]
MPQLTLSRTLAKRSTSELAELFALWHEKTNSPNGRADLLAALAKRMSQPSAVAAIRAQLDETLDPVFRAMSVYPGEGLLFGRIKHDPNCNGVENRLIRSALSELVHLGLASMSMGVRSGEERKLWGIPMEIHLALGQTPQTKGEPGSLLTLRGWLEQAFRRQGQEEPAEQARRMYRFLADDKALLARIDALAPQLKEVYHLIASEWGGIVSIADYQTKALELSFQELIDGLESATLGTVGELDLESFGLRQRGQVIALFDEGVLAYLRREGVVSAVLPEFSASIGVDFVSNFGRFASFVEGENVRFTVSGSLFKSTGKRIAERLIANPGREFRRFEILELEYKFALAHGFIDRTGKRTFSVTPEGFEFLNQSLEDKQRVMLDWLIEDRDLPGDLAHQIPLRRTTLRYLKRLEPNVWYDAMFLPFVVRNHYLGGLSMQARRNGESRSFPVRSSADVRSLAWNLFTWVRKYLYLLGIIDMAYDDSGRATAIRLTTLGAELLEVIPGRDLEAAGRIVVNPDFEVVLFPDVRSHGLVYELDRFCDREKTDSLYHYRISPSSLQRALAEGETLDVILALLQSRSRTPVPQNVLYSLESWARQDGLIHWDGAHALHSEQKEVLDRIALHPQLQALGLDRASPNELQVNKAIPREDLSGWLRDYGVALHIEA